jgi:hypothetical protein
MKAEPLDDLRCNGWLPRRFIIRAALAGSNGKSTGPAEIRAKRDRCDLLAWYSGFLYSCIPACYGGWKLPVSVCRQ